LQTKKDNENDFANIVMVHPVITATLAHR